MSCETVMDNRMKSGCLWTAKQKWSPPPSHGESLIALSISFELLFTCQIFCECSSERFSHLKSSLPACLDLSSQELTSHSLFVTDSII